MGITGDGNYFDDFAVADVFEHARGRTVTDFDNYAVTHMTLNTAEGHFNQVRAREVMDGAFRDRLVAGPCTIAIVVGLTSEDMSENAVREVGLTGIRLPNPVFAGDTLYASSEVLELTADPERGDVGLLRYRFTGRNAEGDVVVEGERMVLVKKRAAWAERDGNVQIAAGERP
ncbi:MAG: MaoC family dehydratase [Alphaproteobacteria bacterium]|jgi:acyl dehydratase|nr:MaoC family dehydratase [Alphaproteobacteria bacterium]